MRWNPKYEVLKVLAYLTASHGLPSTFQPLFKTWPSLTFIRFHMSCLKYTSLIRFQTKCYIGAKFCKLPQVLACQFFESLLMYTHPAFTFALVKYLFLISLSIKHGLNSSMFSKFLK